MAKKKTFTAKVTKGVKIFLQVLVIVLILSMFLRFDFVAEPVSKATGIPQPTLKEWGTIIGTIVIGALALTLGIVFFGVPVLGLGLVIAGSLITAIGGSSLLNFLSGKEVIPGLD